MVESTTNKTNEPVVRPDSYLTLHYRVTALDGEEFLSTFDMSPATLQMGSGQLAENLENVLLGLNAGEHYVFELPPAQAFGEHNERLVERIARTGLPEGMELKENSVVEFSAPNGATFAGFLRSLDATHALFDFNHPMAGKTIRFEVKIIGIM
ncbi:peptidylprolyl isomerase [Azonexus sp. R2A61]|uniref:FKBP-type peptidyl-prolyl cis-trans isomerase n=1 Tax=Azonexus sp. R2A61 TaxID=2744443 RepID=UPI001F34EE95|nr:FKBP-type peptidyl-prolyl cis-trans isomerase [Azonexus sp. R2A61]